MLPVTLRNLEPEVKARMKKVDQEEGIIGKVTGKILNIPPEKGETRSDLVEEGSLCFPGELSFWARKGTEGFQGSQTHGRSCL